MGLKNLFNLSLEKNEKLNEKLESLSLSNNSCVETTNWAPCFSCRGGSCTAGVGGD